ncbi:MAG: hypothetical protein J2P41_06850, partial [Blastocatellia bacterium]|nr:hypothetical protein [Blastocatellia bacterium]
LTCANRRSPMQLNAEDFNLQAENYYRNQLRRRHMNEAFDLLLEDLRALELIDTSFDEEMREALHHCLGGKSAVEFAKGMKNDIAGERANEAGIQALINLVLLSLRHDLKTSERILNAPSQENSIGATASSIR